MGHSQTQLLTASLWETFSNRARRSYQAPPFHEEFFKSRSPELITKRIELSKAWGSSFGPPALPPSPSFGHSVGHGPLSVTILFCSKRKLKTAVHARSWR